MPFEASIRFDVGCADDLAPTFCFFSDQLLEVGGRSGEHPVSELGKPSLYPGIGDGRIDLVVQLVDDLRRRVFGRTDTVPRIAS